MRWLKEKFEQMGDWRLPEKPDDIVAGQIKYDGAGNTRLILNGGFQDIKTGVLQTHDIFGRYPIIHGSINNGHAVTIMNGLTLGTSMASASAGGRFSEEISSNILVVGCHISPDTKFNSFSVVVPGFETWLAKPNIRWEQQADGSETCRTVASPVEEIYIPSISAKLKWCVSRHVTHGFYQTANINIHAGFSFEPDVPQPIEWIYTSLGRITYLMTMLSATPMFAGQISATPVDASRPYGCDMLTKFSIKKTCELTSINDFFMNRAQMGVDFGETIKRWFEKYDDIKYSVHLAVENMCADERWDHIEFNLWTQSLEGFHRATTGDEDMKFAPRLEELAGILSDQGREMLFGPQKMVPRAWVDTRNYYTHWFKNMKNNVLEGKALHVANARLRTFVRVVYLHYAGVPMAAIDKALYGYGVEPQRLAYFLIEEREGRLYQQV